jgi:long-chain acyl-CoA synthetase
MGEKAPAKAAPAPRSAAPFKFNRSASVAMLLNPCCWILWLLDFVVWLIVFLLWPPLWFKYMKFWMPCRKRSYMGQTLVDGGKPIAYRTLAPDNELLNHPFGPELDTVHKVAQKAFQSYANLKCMGTRKFEEWHTPEGARFPLKVFGSSSWKTFLEVQQEAQRFGKGLRELGLCEPMPIEMAQKVTGDFAQIEGNHCVLIFEETCADWLTATLGCMGQSVTVATSYATLGMNAVAEALNQTNSPVIVCNYSNVEKVAGLAAECPNLKAIIYTRNCVEEDKPEKPETIGNLRVFSMAAIRAAAPEVADMNAYSEPTPEHVGLIMYTSGSTGKPKGVMLKHSAIVAAIAGLENHLNRDGLSSRATGDADQETYLAYLPAAHILEFAAEMSMLAHGACMGYAAASQFVPTLKS